jgi:hypothetical protein
MYTCACTYIPHRKPSRTKLFTRQNICVLHVHVHISPIENQTGQHRAPQDKIISTAKYLCFISPIGNQTGRHRAARQRKSHRTKLFTRQNICVFYTRHLHRVSKPRTPDCVSKPQIKSLPKYSLNPKPQTKPLPKP